MWDPKKKKCFTLISCLCPASADNPAVAAGGSTEQDEGVGVGSGREMAEGGMETGGESSAARTLESPCRTDVCDNLLPYTCMSPCTQPVEKFITLVGSCPPSFLTCDGAAQTLTRWPGHVRLDMCDSRPSSEEPVWAEESLIHYQLPTPSSYSVNSKKTLCSFNK